jgi:alpha-tubulin suppressor-like RCC1 family protein
MPRSRRVGQLVVVAALTAGLACREVDQSPLSPDAEPGQVAALAAPLSFRQLSAGKWHTCGVATNNRAYCWGDNSTGQLGDGTNLDRSRPTPVAGGHSFVLVSAGLTYSCGITTENRAYCWGQNTAGQLGDGTTIDRRLPVQVAGGRRFQQVRSGAFHTCAVNPSNVAFCWGQNSNGQLGTGNTKASLVPVRVKGGLEFRRVFTAGLHTCGATLDDRGYCWGRNEDGQLGDGTTIQKFQPTLVTGGRRFSQVMVGAAQGGAWNSVSCGLTTASRAYCWGDNVAGAIGDGTSGFNLRRPTPTAVLGGLLFSGVSTGGVHTCGVTTNNVAYCWGSDGNWQSGDGDFSQNDHLTPNPVAGGHAFRAITTGTFHTCAITTTDRAYCWGNNSQGQLGLGFVDGNPFTPKVAPTPVVGPS